MPLGKKVSYWDFSEKRRKLAFFFPPLNISSYAGGSWTLTGLLVHLLAQHTPALRSQRLPACPEPPSTSHISKGGIPVQVGTGMLDMFLTQDPWWLCTKSSTPIYQATPLMLFCLNQLSFMTPFSRPSWRSRLPICMSMWSLMRSSALSDKYLP